MKMNQLMLIGCTLAAMMTETRANTEATVRASVLYPSNHLPSGSASCSRCHTGISVKIGNHEFKNIPFTNGQVQGEGKRFPVADKIQVKKGDKISYELHGNYIHPDSMGVWASCGEIGDIANLQAVRLSFTFDAAAKDFKCKYVAGLPSKK